MQRTRCYVAVKPRSTEPVLYIIGSYGVHMTFFNAKRQPNHNIFIVIAPPNLTNIIQPLDVAINRSFQAFHVIYFDDYIDNAISDVRTQTKAGNPKCPHYLMVTTWCQKWIESFPDASIAKAFAVVWSQRLCLTLMICILLSMPCYRAITILSNGLAS
jgi:hypothetical protein